MDVSSDARTGDHGAFLFLPTISSFRPPILFFLHILCTSFALTYSLTVNAGLRTAGLVEYVLSSQTNVWHAHRSLYAWDLTFRCTCGRHDAESDRGNGQEEALSGGRLLLH